MSDRRDDERVRELFAALREGAPEPPSFRRIWEKAARGPVGRGRLWRPALAAAVALAAVAVTVLLLRTAGPGAPGPVADPVELARALSTWEAPLDFLLVGPEEELYRGPRGRRSLLGSIPDLGGVAEGPTAPEARGGPAAPAAPTASEDPIREETS